MNSSTGWWGRGGERRWGGRSLQEYRPGSRSRQIHHITDAALTEWEHTHLLGNWRNCCIDHSLGFLSCKPTWRDFSLNDDSLWCSFSYLGFLFTIPLKFLNLLYFLTNTRHSPHCPLPVCLPIQLGGPVQLLLVDLSCWSLSPVHTAVPNLFSVPSGMLIVSQHNSGLFKKKNPMCDSWFDNYYCCLILQRPI